MTSGLDFSFGVAFLGGVLSFLSPCVLPLIPGYLCFAAGMEFDELSHADRADISGRVLPGAIAFVFGFALIFVSLGAGAATISPLLLQYKDILAQLAGGIIVLLGLHIAGVFRFAFLQRDIRLPFATSTRKMTPETHPEAPSTISSTMPPAKDTKVLPQITMRLATSFVFGLAFAFGWTPCIGPILATVLTLAASGDSLQYGIALLGVYAAGLGLPFIIAACAVSYFMQASGKIKKYMPVIEKITGGLLIITGLLLGLGTLQGLAGYLLNWFPILAKLG